MGLRLQLLTAAMRSFVKPQIADHSAASLRVAAHRVAAFLTPSGEGGFQRQRLCAPQGAAATPVAPAPRLASPEVPSLAWFDDHRLDLVDPRPADRVSGAPGVLLFFHGGGYVCGAPETHRSMIAGLARGSGLPVAALDHRLAPEHPFPAAFEDACAAVAALREAGAAVERIALAGDGAGGGLALALAAALGAEGAAPAAVAAFSPWTDLALTGASLSRNAQREALSTPERRRAAAEAYLAGADPRDPRASPLYAQFRRPPPTLLQIGSHEALRDDGLRMAEALRRAGGDVRLEIFRGAPHGFQLFTPVLAEAASALTSAARFLRERVDAAAAAHGAAAA